MAQSEKQIDALSVDWELANTAAAEWARRYGFDLVSQITDTTRQRLQREISAFVENQENMGQLRARLESLFGEVRADLIASTEVTRAFAEGNRQAWRESGVVQMMEWRTSNDEIVCPICGPLNGTQAPIDGEFEGGISAPPAHPRCRCWVVPVVAEPELFTVEDEIALIEGESEDVFADIRPPAGRAPRGKGEEYRLRRRLVSRIQTHMRWREAARRQLREYRGQTSARLRWRIDVATERVKQLDRAISAAIDIASDPYTADWAFKTELVDSIFEYVSELRT